MEVNQCTNSFPFLSSESRYSSSPVNGTLVAAAAGYGTSPSEEFFKLVLYLIVMKISGTFRC